MDLSSPLRYLEMLTSDYSFFLVQEHGRIALLPLEVDYGRPRDLLWPIKCAGVPDVASGRSIFLLQTLQCFRLPAAGTNNIPEGGGSVDQSKGSMSM